MAQTTEERLARLEAISEMDESTGMRLERRLDSIEASIQELNMDMLAAKTAGKLALGAAAVVGGILGTLINWFIQLKK